MSEPLLSINQGAKMDCRKRIVQGEDASHNSAVKFKCEDSSHSPWNQMDWPTIYENLKEIADTL